MKNIALIGVGTQEVSEILRVEANRAQKLLAAYSELEDWVVSNHSHNEHVKAILSKIYQLD